MIKSNYFFAMCLGIISSLGISQTAPAYDFEAGDIKASIYGYAQLNAVYDINEDINDGSVLAGDFSKLKNANATGAPEGHFNATAQQSRIGFSATHKNGVKIVLETDFRYGDFRIRHAYGAYKNWLIGRNWSNYNSWTGWTPTIDFDTSAGAPGVQDRIEQVRYTQHYGPGSVSVALEKDYYPTIGGGNAKSELPTLTVRYEGEIQKGVNIVVAGVLRQLTYDDGMNDESEFGFGGFTGVAYSFGKFSIQGVVNYSDGASAYLYRSGSNFNGIDAYYNDGSLETISGWGGTIGVSAKVGQGDINIVYGSVELDLDDYNRDIGVPAGTHESNSNVFVNYQWHPVDHVMMGVEYGYFTTDLYNGGSPDASRIMYAARYSF